MRAVIVYEPAIGDKHIESYNNRVNFEKLGPYLASLPQFLDVSTKMMIAHCCMIPNSAFIASAQGEESALAAMLQKFPKPDNGLHFIVNDESLSDCMGDEALIVYSSSMQDIYLRVAAETKVELRGDRNFLETFPNHLRAVVDRLLKLQYRDAPNIAVAKGKMSTEDLVQFLRLGPNIKGGCYFIIGRLHGQR